MMSRRDGMEGSGREDKGCCPSMLKALYIGVMAGELCQAEGRMVFSAWMYRH